MSVGHWNLGVKVYNFYSLASSFLPLLKMKALLCLAVVLAVAYSSQAYNPDRNLNSMSREEGAQEMLHVQATREPLLTEGLHGPGEGHEHEKLGANNNRKRRCFWPFYSYYDYYGYEPYAVYPGGYAGGYY